MYILVNLNQGNKKNLFKWIAKYNIPFDKNINTDILDSFISFESNGFSSNFNGEPFMSFGNIPNLCLSLPKEINQFPNLQRRIDLIWKAYIQAFYYSKGLNHIGNFSLDRTKITDLLDASNSNISIPRTIISTSKQQVYDFFKNRNKGIICKTFLQSKLIKEKGHRIRINDYVNVDIDTICQLSDYFLPTLFQEKVKVKYEIRIFHFQSVFFPMVIHHNEGDIENGKYTKNFHISRESPFRLPEELEDKLNAFCSQKNSKQGSIDLLVDETESKFYFLEENNFGEYEYLNNNCNYNINEYIAKWIKKNFRI